MRFSCPFCNYAMTVDDSACGYRVTCASCGKSILVPTSQYDEGCIIGDFIIKSKLGAGSIGAVFRAQQISLDRQVALKVLSPRYLTTRGTSDFLKEARAAAKLSHTNLVQSYAVGEDNGIFYMAMTYIKGETVKARLLREKKIPVDEALHIVQQVAEALYYAWNEIGMIHRDVKPDNIMVTDDGIVKLTDLGLAMNQADWREDMEISGSPSYMSPEQFSGEKLDTRSDIYSLGVTLYQMISGQLPFNADTVRSIAKQHFEEQAVPLNRIDPSVPAKVSQLVERMMAKYPDERFKDMEALLNDIWAIRQKTAPNKSLVPDVHTISIKRLDYDIQHESLEAKRNVRKIEDKIKTRYDFMRIVLIALPLFMILAIVMSFAFGSRRTEAESGLQKKADAFERFAQDKTLPTAVILEEGQRLLDEIGTPSNIAQQAVTSCIRVAMLQVQLSQSASDLIDETEKSASADAALAAARREIETLRLEKTGSPAAPAVESVPKIDPAELNQLRDRLAKSEETAASLVAVNRDLSRNMLEKSKNDLLRRILRLQQEFRFNVVDVLLVSEEQKVPDLKNWLAGFEKDNSFLSKLYAAVTDSGTKYSQSVFNSDCKVMLISNGFIDYLDGRGRTRQKEWRELSSDTLFEILSRDSREFLGTEVEIKAGLEQLKGNYGQALSLAPKHVERLALMETLYLDTLENIRVALPPDRKLATQIGQKFLKQVSGAPRYDQWKNGIKQALKQ